MGESNEKKKRMSCAIEIENPCNLPLALHTASTEGFHFIVTNIIHPHSSSNLDSKEDSKLISRTDRILSSYEWSKLIVGKVSKAFQVENEIEYIREKEIALLNRELGFASHLVLPAIMLRLTQRDNRNLAHILYNKFQSGACYQVWINLPMTSPSKCSPFTKDQDPEDMWEWWNDLRRYTNYHKKLGLALELPKYDHVPSDLEIQRWLGEPVKVIIIPTRLFISNNHNQPVLPRAYQEVIKKFMILDVQYIIKGPRLNYTYQKYCSYINYLGKKLYDNSVYSEFSVGCEDFLQNPLQPLSEHLETPVYEIFEKDSVKYVAYQTAIQKALEDQSENKDVIVIMVVGAGRGPLVQAALNASYLTQRKVRVYAVEKNPYAVNTLEERIQNEWKGMVILLHEDMRVCKPPEDADILVSELLGSFGDNELSPECLDGAQRFLKKDGISIPQSYTSYLAPLQSTKLYNEILVNRQPDKTLHSLFETPYVVHLVNAYQIAQSQQLFTFVHPNWSEKINNDRMATLKFLAPQNCLLTGFAGFFETVLYKDVMLSTNPQTHSANMVSWFPILFPLPNPIQISEGNIIEVTFWRGSNEEKVWYEWCLTSPIKGSINNAAVAFLALAKFRMSHLKLLYNPISPPCRFILMLSEVINLNVQLQEVDILNKKYVQQISKLNPQHTVPTLQDGKVTLWESHAMAPYLVAKYAPDDSLYPRNINKRAVVDQRLHFDSGVMYPLLKRIIKPILFRNQFGIYKSDVQDIKTVYTFMDDFSRNNDWLCGDAMTIADLSCIATLSTLDMLYPVNSKTYPNLFKFIKHCERMPCYFKCNVKGLDMLSKEIHTRLTFCNKYKCKAYV